MGRGRGGERAGERKRSEERGEKEVEEQSDWDGITVTAEMIEKTPFGESGCVPNKRA